MCDKNSLEAGTGKVDLINTLYAKLSDTDIFMFYSIHYIKSVLVFFSNQYSKIECTVRSFGHTVTYNLKTSVVQGVHHAGVAVELGLLLKDKKMVLMILSRLLFNFTTYFTLAECNRILLVQQELGKDVHHAGVAVKMNLSMLRCANMISFSFNSLLYLAECKLKPWLIATMSLMKTSSVRALHHAGVAACVQQTHEEADEEGDPDAQEALQEEAETKLLLVVGVLQLYEDVDLFGFCRLDLSYLNMWEIAESFL